MREASVAGTIHPLLRSGVVKLTRRPVDAVQLDELLGLFGMKVGIPRCNNVVVGCSRVPIFGLSSRGISLPDMS